MIKDTIVFTNRTLKHITRSADTIITTALMPICFLLLFVYVFGGAIKASIALVLISIAYCQEFC